MSDVDTQVKVATIPGFTNPKISIVTATYNRLAALQRTIRSVLVQSYQNFEMLIVNDCGEDISKTVEEFNDPRIFCFTNAKNSGLGYSRNVGMTHSSGKYITFLDDDDIFLLNHLEILTRYLEGTTFKIVYTDAIRNVQRNNGDGSYTTLTRDIPYSLDFNEDLILIQNLTPVLCVGFDRVLVEEIGNFDIGLAVYEDWDLWIRFSRKYPMLHIPVPTCEFTWREDGTSMSSSKQEFTSLIPEIYKRYQDFKDRDKGIKNRNQVLNSRGLPIIIE